MAFETLSAHDEQCSEACRDRRALDHVAAVARPRDDVEMREPCGPVVETFGSQPSRPGHQVVDDDSRSADRPGTGRTGAAGRRSADELAGVRRGSDARPGPDPFVERLVVDTV